MYTFIVIVNLFFVQMTQEISIHRGVHHKHIVGFQGFFEDNDNVYILLELCRRRVSFLYRNKTIATYYKFSIHVNSGRSE